ncbi:MAG: YigZ family protein, partial [Bacteroidetes bacterium]
MSASTTDTYKTIAAPAEGLFRDRGSKFLAYAFPVRTEAEALARLEEVRKAHPKARHHCFAWRLGYDGTRFRANDDGEPSGTAGRPILGQIDSFGLTNVVVIVVRYFGGTLLGTSGLIRAYREATADALGKARIVERVREQHVRLSFDYTLMGPVMSALERLGLQPLSQQFDTAASLEVAIRLSELD